MDRIKLIKQLQEIRNSSVICYITGDRERFNTKISDDVVSIFYRHLELMNYRDNIDLFLYTRGGDMITPIRLVKLIRSYCKKFGVLIPYRDHSAGTLVALGADEIVMTKIVKEITSDICIHNYPIYRDEAKKLGLKVLAPEEELERVLWNIYEDYVEKMELNKKFNPLEILGSDNSKKIKYGAANIESLNARDTFYYNINLNKVSVQQKPGIPSVTSVNVKVEDFAWEKVR